MSNSDREYKLLTSLYEDYNNRINGFSSISNQRALTNEATDLIDNDIELALKKIDSQSFDENDKNILKANFVFLKAKACFFLMDALDENRVNKIKTDTFSGVAMGLINKGIMNSKLQTWFNKAHEYALKSNEIYSNQSADYLLGTIYEQKKEINKALEYYRKASEGEDDEISISAEKEIMRIENPKKKKGFFNNLLGG